MTKSPTLNAILGGEKPFLSPVAPRIIADHESTIVPRPLDPPPADLSRYLASVPVARFVEMDCDLCLRQLEATGVRVDRGKGSSAIDQARNVRASQAIRDGYESILFIDSDMLFDPLDAIKLFRRPEPVVAGVYAAKLLKHGQLNAWFGEGITEVRFGAWADRLYPVRRIGGGFLRIKVDFLKRMVRELKLPYCRSGGTFAWPFFQPVVVRECGEDRYLTEDYAFSWRCCQMGTPPLADTSFRLWHIGDYTYGLEEAGGDYIERAANVLHQVPDAPRTPAPPIPADMTEVA
jgi:hypothetical protein